MIKKMKQAKIIALANERFDVPKGYNYLKYYDDVDVLYINYSNNKAVIGDDDLDKGLVYDLDSNNNIVGIEVLNLFGKFTNEIFE